MFHLKLEIALAIPATNEWKIIANNVAVVLLDLFIHFYKLVAKNEKCLWNLAR